MYRAKCECSQFLYIHVSLVVCEFYDGSCAILEMERGEYVLWPQFKYVKGYKAKI